MKFKKDRKKPSEREPVKIDFSQWSMDDSLFIPLSAFKNEKALRGSIYTRAKNYGITVKGHKIIEDGIEGICFWRRK